MSATWKGRKGLNLAHEATKKLGDVGRPSNDAPPPIALYPLRFLDPDRAFPWERGNEWRKELPRVNLP